MQCGSWMFGSSARSGGMYAARIPRACTDQLAPPSRVAQAPPQETNEQPARVARIDADRVDAGRFGAAAEPFAALGPVPERAHQLPGVAAVARAEQPSRQRPRPE